MSRAEEEPEVEEGGPEDPENIHEEANIEIEEEDDMDVGDIKAVPE